MPDSDTIVTTAGENALGFRNRSENFSVHLDNAQSMVSMVATKHYTVMSNENRVNSAQCLCIRMAVKSKRQR